MALRNDPIYRVLKNVTQHVFYLENLEDNQNLNNQMPFIVWSVVTKKPLSADNKTLIYRVLYQITIVTKKRSEALIHRFETMMNDKELIPTLISSYQNDDYSLNRVYHVTILTKGGY